MATSGKPPKKPSEKPPAPCNTPCPTNTQVNKEADKNLKDQNAALSKTTVGNPTKRQCNTSRKDFEIWNYFEHNEDPVNPRASCIYCDKSYAVDRTRHGTSTLWNHLLKLCPNSPCQDDSKQKKLSFEPQDGQTRLNQMCEGNDQELKSMAEGMKLKLEKYWENLDNMNLLLYVAVVLDARYKLKYVKFWLENMYSVNMANDLIRDVEYAMDKLYEHYLKHHGQANSNTDESASVEDVSNNSNKGSSSMDVDDEDYSSFVKSQFKRHLMEEEFVEKKSEVAKYLMEACENGDDKSFDILVWWKNNASKYPILSLVAKDVLAMSVSSVPSESAFSTGGRTLDPFRSSLSPKTVEALICGQNWLRSSNVHYELREEMEDAVKYDLAALESAPRSSGGRATVTIQG